MCKLFFLCMGIHFFYCFGAQKGTTAPFIELFKNFQSIKSNSSPLSTPRSPRWGVTPRIKSITNQFEKEVKSEADTVYIMPYFFDGTEQYIVVNKGSDQLIINRSKDEFIDKKNENSEDDESTRNNKIKIDDNKIIDFVSSLVSGYSKNIGEPIRGRDIQSHCYAIEISSNKMFEFAKNGTAYAIISLTDDSLKSKISNEMLYNFINISCKKTVNFILLFYYKDLNGIIKILTLSDSDEKSYSKRVLRGNASFIEQSVQNILFKDILSTQEQSKDLFEISHFFYIKKEKQLDIFQFVDVTEIIDLTTFFQGNNKRRYRFSSIEELVKSTFGLYDRKYKDLLEELYSHIKNNENSDFENISKNVSFKSLFINQYQEAIGIREKAIQEFVQKQKELDEEQKKKQKQKEEKVAQEKREIEKQSRSSLLPVTPRQSQSEEHNVKVKPHLENITQERKKVLSRSASLGTVVQQSAERGSVSEAIVTNKTESIAPDLQEESGQPKETIHENVDPGKNNIKEKHNKSEEKEIRMSPSYDQPSLSGKSENKSELSAGATQSQQPSNPVDMSGVPKEIEQLQERSRRKQQKFFEAREQKQLRERVATAKKRKNIREEPLFINSIMPYVTSVIKSQRSETIMPYCLSAAVFEELKTIDVVCIAVQFDRIKDSIPESYVETLSTYSRTGVITFSDEAENEYFLFVTTLDQEPHSYLAWIVLTQNSAYQLFEDYPITKKVFPKIKIGPLLYLGSQGTEKEYLCERNVALIPMRALLMHVQKLFPARPERIKMGESAPAVSTYPPSAPTIGKTDEKIDDAVTNDTSTVLVTENELSKITQSPEKEQQKETVYDEKQDVGKIEFTVQSPWWEKMWIGINQWWNAAVQWAGSIF